MTSSFEPFRFAVRPGEPATRSLSPQHAGAAVLRKQRCFRSSTLVYAGAIQKHLDAETNSFFRGVGTIADRELLDRDDTERCGDNPACRTGNPAPSVLVGIEANVAIGGLEFPSPEPVRLSAPLCD